MGKRFDLSDQNKRSMRDRRIGKKKMNKEKVTMLVASVAVLGALTFTGIYLGSRGDNKDEQQRIDFSALENPGRQQAEQNQTRQNENTATNGFQEHDDLDVDPDLYAEFQQTNSGDVINPGLESAQGNETAQGNEAAQGEGDVQGENVASLEGEDDSSDSMSYLPPEEEPSIDRSEQTSAGPSREEIVESKIETARQTLQFSESDTLAWPVVGNVLINYSMDGYVYFSTLGQYRYSPAIVIAAVQGQHINSASDGIVSDVFYNEEIGNAVTVSLGSGYELTYGQLTDIVVKKGDYVGVGDLIGKVAQPTKYYTIEGTNVYFAMTKNGEPVNPLTLLQ